MIAALSDSQDHDVGDGTTSVVLLTGQLLRQCTALLDTYGVHPCVLVRALSRVAARGVQHLPTLGVDCPEGSKFVESAALTALHSKIVGERTCGSVFARIALQSVACTAAPPGAAAARDCASALAQINVVRLRGGELRDSHVVSDGVVLLRNVSTVAAHASPQTRSAQMPRAAADARVCVLTGAQLFCTPGTGAAARRTFEPTPTLLVNRIVSAGATVVFCQDTVGEIPDAVLGLFAAAGVMVVPQLSEQEVRVVCGAVAAVPLTAVLDTDLAPCLGRARNVCERMVSDRVLLHVAGLPDSARVCTIVLRGPSDEIIAEAERALHDAQCVVHLLLASAPAVVVPGGGAVEAALSAFFGQLADPAQNLDAPLNPVELACASAWSRALEALPRLLVANAGLDPVNTTGQLLRHHRATAAAADPPARDRQLGVDLASGALVDMVAAGVVEPLRVKAAVLERATECVAMCLRIDEILL
eukprot:gnl/Spiro4/5624_TR2866_c0_g1_i1.p1 gnl/Spiro4/5624_TR2866_c0_g1~~gnl/Spiro4/5624_TR2866_c0_g1_i1.p1  ORF type:complete len:474 (-),score=145.61 gnl/Spiro4/5624_TR2866_c0_g1_i1:129-1550(-)